MLKTFSMTALAAAALLMYPAPASAHCDAMDGPVVQAARQALERDDVTPALSWVAPEQEPDVRAAFTRTMAVRKLGAEARALADVWFFETLVRIHRAGEGEPFEGLKPAGHIEPFVAAVDRSLASGSVDDVIARMNTHIAAGIRERFARAREAGKTAGKDVASGREYVAAYVDYLHFVEAVDKLTAAKKDAHAHEDR